MPTSTWSICANSSNEDSAMKVLNNCIKAISRAPSDFSLEKYPKGGFMARFKLYHSDDNSWPINIEEILILAQRLGIGWRIFGSVEEDVSLTLSDEASGRFKLSGINFAEIILIKD
ncbi:MAG: hypothetical protein HWE16_14335 [Gammaproteobacteria bacterium]|nr:hypothetical protein [Gammaproteobacteria bacterium]